MRLRSAGVKQSRTKRVFCLLHRLYLRDRLSFPLVILIIFLIPLLPICCSKPKFNNGNRMLRYGFIITIGCSVCVGVCGILRSLLTRLAGKLPIVDHDTMYPFSGALALVGSTLLPALRDWTNGRKLVHLSRTMKFQQVYYCYLIVQKPSDPRRPDPQTLIYIPPPPNQVETTPRPNRGLQTSCVMRIAVEPRRPSCHSSDRSSRPLRARDRRRASIPLPPNRWVGFGQACWGGGTTNER